MSEDKRSELGVSHDAMLEFGYEYDETKEQYFLPKELFNKIDLNQVQRN